MLLSLIRDIEHLTVNSRRIKVLKMCTHLRRILTPGAKKLPGEGVTHSSPELSKPWPGRDERASPLHHPG